MKYSVRRQLVSEFYQFLVTKVNNWCHIVIK